MLKGVEHRPLKPIVPDMLKIIVPPDLLQLPVTLEAFGTCHTDLNSAPDKFVPTHDG
jgi:hypothetical protein